MEKIKSLDVLVTLSITELKEFNRFINSPLHNRNKNVTRFYNLLKENNFILDKAGFYGKIFPGMKYNDIKVRQLLNNLLNLLYDYLTLIEIRTESAENRIKLLTQLMKRGLGKQYEIEYNKTRDQLEKNDIKDYYHYYCNYMLENTNLSYISQQSRYFTHLSDAMNRHQDIFNKYIIHLLLKINLERIAVRKYSDKITLIFFDELMQHLKMNKYEDVNINLMYRLIMMQYYGDDDDAYDKYKKILFKNIHIFKTEEKVNYFIALTNYCSKKSLAGNMHYTRELLKHYKFILQNHIYEIYENNKIHHVVYINIARTALMLNQYKWVNEFIENYHVKLTNEHNESAFNLSMAIYNYETGLHDKALAYLSKVKTIDVNYKLEIKKLFLKICYTAGDTDLFNVNLDSYRQLIKRNRVQFPQYLQEYHENFIKFFRKLLKLNLKSKKAVINKFKNEITNASYLEKSWFLKQITNM